MHEERTKIFMRLKQKPSEVPFESGLRDTGIRVEGITPRQRIMLRTIRRASGFIDLVVLVMSLLLLFVGVYAVWDARQVVHLADVDEYSQYKVVKDQQLSYAELRRLNPNIVGWIDVYGTKIDYPILQGEDNSKYLSETVTGEFSTAGSIMLDYRNRADFTDFNSLIYGHHMDERKMFGDVDRFADSDFFDAHEYGLLHRADLPSQGIEFFALVKTHGSDPYVFNVGLSREDAKRELIDYLYANAVHSRDIGVSTDDRIVLLNTCTFTTANGHYVLVGRLSDTVRANTFPPEEGSGTSRFDRFLDRTTRVPLLLWIIIIVLVIALLSYLFEKSRYEAQLKRERKLRAAQSARSRIGD